jgi:hypothetical protein
MRRDKSFADDLFARLGAVRGRVALLLRSTEAKPTSSRFVPRGTRQTPPDWQAGRERAVERRETESGSGGGRWAEVGGAGGSEGVRE